MSNKNIIEINGKRYDAVTGQLLAHQFMTPSPNKAPDVKQPAHLHTPKATSRAVKHAPRHAPSPSKTLMRRGVKKPTSSPKRHIKTQTELGRPLEDAHWPEPAQVEHRLTRAKQVPKSPLIRHFSPPTAAHAGLAAPAPMLVLKPHSSAAVHSRTNPAGHKTAPRHKVDILLERALERAKAHEQKPLKLHRHNRLNKRVGIIGSAALAVALISAVAVQNLSAAQLQTASAEAGFSAQLPNYKPAGFGSAKIDSSPGVVTARFRGKSPAESYTIMQRASTWSSLELRQKYVKTVDPNYRTLGAKGLTVYVYGNGDATWVSAGIWYLVHSNGSLTDHQLAELAATL